MKTIDVKVSSNETSSTIDLFSDIDASSETKEAIKKDVGDFLVEKILESVSSLSSPVSGGGFKKTLSKEYKKLKVSEGGSNVPDLELSGLMLNKLEYKPTKEGIKIGVFGDAAPRADGHNNLSGDSKLPERKFLPNVGESFKSNIESEIEAIIADHLLKEADIKKKELEELETTSEVYSYLQTFLPDYSKNQIKKAVIRNEDLFKLLEDKL